MNVRWKLAELASNLTCIAIVMFIYYLLFPRFRSWHPYVALAVGVVVALGCIYFLWLALHLFLRLRIKLPAMRFLLPFMLFWGRVLGMDKETVRNHIIQLNNRIVTGWIREYRPKKMLILLPHCLQRYECLVKITNDIHYCKDCGRCIIPRIRDRADEADVKASVVTGGTEARRQMRASGAELIIACACERDLLSGILDAYPTPVFGMLNQRPHGPCRNTTMDITDLDYIFDLCGRPPAEVKL